MKDKPTKWGIKVFVLSDAPTGYVKRMQVYTGQGLDNCVSDVGLCTQGGVRFDERFLPYGGSTVH